MGTVHQMLPWKNKLCRLEMKGKDIKQVLEAQVSGPLHCCAQSGLKIQIDTSKQKGRRLLSVKMADGKEFKDDQVYTVATEDLFAEGSFGMTGFKNALSKKTTEKDVREILVEAIEENPVVDAKVDGRMINHATQPE